MTRNALSSAGAYNTSVLVDIKVMNAFDILVGKQHSSRTSEENVVLFEQRHIFLYIQGLIYMEIEAVEVHAMQMPVPVEVVEPKMPRP